MLNFHLKHIYVGVDIGGTKSMAWLCDSAGRVLGTGLAGAGERRGDDYSVMAQVLNEITTQATNEAGIRKADITTACFGISGYDWPSQRQPHLDTIAKIGLDARIELVNDVLLVLHAGSESGSGIALIAGTYCNCLGRMADGRSGRVVGEGHLFGEGAGASELVVQAKHAVAAAWTMAGPSTLLTEMFISYTGAVDADDMIEGLVTRRYTLKPDAAPLVFEAAKAGDGVARDLVEWAVEALVSMVLSVTRQMQAVNEAIDIVMGGGFFKAGTILTDPMKASIRAEIPDARFVHLTAPPVAGAILLAMRHNGVPSADIATARTRLLEHP